jgi:hypothetical protein
LLALLALPLCVPTLIFGAAAVEAVAIGEGFLTHLAILARSACCRSPPCRGRSPLPCGKRRVDNDGRGRIQKPMASLHVLANPARFRRFSQRVLPALSAVTAAVLLVGLWLALVRSPPDYQQGETVRIMFCTCPRPGSHGGLRAARRLGAALLVWRHPLAALMARAAAPVGAVFAAVCLLTGSLWGRPMWGTYWVWDARLTSMLLLFFLYLGHIALSRAYDDRSAATAPPRSWRWSARSTCR